MKKIAIIGIILLILAGLIIGFTVLSEDNSNNIEKSKLDNITENGHYNTKEDMVAYIYKFHKHIEKSNLDNITENGHYNTKEDVAAYIYKFHKVPGNYITKNEAKKLGWSGGSLSKIAPGKSIGGDVFTNREKILPEGHRYIECDIDTDGGDTRGAKRIVYSADDFKIYYTDDHYSTFTEIKVGD